VAEITSNVTNAISLFIGGIIHAQINLSSVIGYFIKKAILPGLRKRICGSAILKTYTYKV
jgi:hypothetical protein